MMKNIQDVGIMSDFIKDRAKEDTEPYMAAIVKNHHIKAGQMEQRSQWKWHSPSKTQGG